MNKLALSLVGLTAFTTFASSAEARERCDRPGYGYGYYRPSVRVYHVERPRYYDDNCRHSAREYRYHSRCDDRNDRRHESHSHHGFHGFFGHLFR